MGDIRVIELTSAKVFYLTEAVHICKYKETVILVRNIITKLAPTNGSTRRSELSVHC